VEINLWDVVGKMIIRQLACDCCWWNFARGILIFLKDFKEMMLQADNCKGDRQDAESEKYTVFDLEITC